MHRLIDYFRQCFCDHEFTHSECVAEKQINGRAVKQGTKVSMLCTKCGYHKSFWKY